MTDPLPRDHKKLCARPVDIRPVDEPDRDLVYCGLHVAHAGPHIAMVWWFDENDGASFTESPPSLSAGLTGDQRLMLRQALEDAQRLEDDPERWAEYGRLIAGCEGD